MPFSYGDDSVVLSARPYLKLHSGRAFSYSTCSLRCSLSFWVALLRILKFKTGETEERKYSPGKAKSPDPELAKESMDAQRVEEERRHSGHLETLCRKVASRLKWSNKGFGV